MDIYQQYALNKAKIKDLQDECKQIEEQITDEVKKNDNQIKKDYGTFMISKRKQFEYSAKLTEQIDKVETAKKVEEVKGIAKVTEKEFFRFTPSKFAVPPGLLKFGQSKPMGKLTVIKN